MASTVPDFWPALEAEKLRTPLLILKEQAAALGRKTNNLLEGQVQTAVYKSDFVHRFLVVAPTLNNYSFQLFQIRHPIDLYPVVVTGASVPGPDEFGFIPIDADQFTLNSESEFVDWLRHELSSERTKRILTALLSQIAA